MTPAGRARRFKTPYSEFIYRPSPIEKKVFFIGVERIKINDQYVYMATPLRALADYVFWHKVKNANLDFLVQSLRIEPEYLAEIHNKDHKEQG